MLKAWGGMGLCGLFSSQQTVSILFFFFPLILNCFHPWHYFLPLLTHCQECYYHLLKKKKKRLQNFGARTDLWELVFMNKLWPRQFKHLAQRRADTKIKHFYKVPTSVVLLRALALLFVSYLPLPQERVSLLAKTSLSLFFIFFHLTDFCGALLPSL